MGTNKFFHDSKTFFYGLIILLLDFSISMVNGNPCLNGGSPVFLSIDNSEFRCNCKQSYTGPFCELQDTTKIPAQQNNNEVGFDGTFLNVLLCMFFLIILPSLILYCIRTMYVFFKRRYYYQPPPPSSSSQRGDPLSSQSSSSYLRRTATEVVVQLPPNFARPLHGTRSMLPLHTTTSLTLNEFHNLLVDIQRELLSTQQREFWDQPENDYTSSRGASHNLPPPYEAVVSRGPPSCTRRESSNS